MLPTTDSPIHAIERQGQVGHVLVALALRSRTLTGFVVSDTFAKPTCYTNAAVPRILSFLQAGPSKRVLQPAQPPQDMMNHARLRFPLLGHEVTDWTARHVKWWKESGEQHNGTQSKQ